MQREDPERALARQTGESLGCIRQMGFQLVTVNYARPYRRRFHSTDRNLANTSSMPSASETTDEVA